MKFGFGFCGVISQVNFSKVLSFHTKNHCLVAKKAKEREKKKQKNSSLIPKIFFFFNSELWVTLRDAK